MLGQPDFTSSAASTTQNGLSNPYQIVFDAADSLWVTDDSNNRVLRFDDPANKANGANADGVLGQPDFTSNTSATTATGMSSPEGVEVDLCGALWVSDYSNHRVLRFDDVVSKANGAAADGVLGAPDFVTIPSTATQSTNGGPWGVTADGYDGIWVADYNYSRILHYSAQLSCNPELTAIDVGDTTLSPPFASAVYIYTAHVDLSVTSFPITPTADLGATMTINGVDVAGGALTSVPLEPGLNTITMVVTAGDGSGVRTYTFLVTRGNFKIWLPFVGKAS